MHDYSDVLGMCRSASPYSNSEDGFSDGGDKREAHGNGEEGDAKGFELFEPFSPVNSPDHLFDLSDEEILPTKRVCASFPQFNTNRALASLKKTVFHVYFFSPQLPLEVTRNCLMKRSVLMGTLMLRR